MPLEMTKTERTMEHPRRLGWPLLPYRGDQTYDCNGPQSRDGRDQGDRLLWTRGSYCPAPRPVDDLRVSTYPEHLRLSESRALARKQVPSVIGFIVAGLIIGALARLVKPGKQNLSVVATLLLGLVGSVIGGVIANLLGTGSIFELNALGFIVAVISSVLLIGAAEAVTSNKKT